jgi:ankyrin repeat protein
MVRRLLKAGADVNGTTEHGATALMAAAGMRQTAVVRVLLEYGADVNVQDEDGETALSCASDIGAEEIMEMLRGAVAC